MKIITILSLCLTASLSFAHSGTLDKTNDDAFTYDYSRICEKGCFRFTLDTAYDPYGLTNPLIDPFDFTFQISSEPDPEAEYIKYAINKFTSKMKYGFPSTADANAYFNLHILNNTLNNQLGHLRWITELAHRATNDNTLDIQVSKNSYLINFGATITEHLAPPLFPLYKALNDTTDNTFSYKYLWLCNNVLNCQFIKRSDICDRSSHVFSSYDIHTTFSDRCNPYMSYRYIPLELPGFSSETDAKINIQLFDSPTVLKNKQDHPTKMKHDF